MPSPSESTGAGVSGGGTNPHSSEFISSGLSGTHSPSTHFIFHKTVPLHSSLQTTSLLCIIPQISSEGIVERVKLNVLVLLVACVLRVVVYCITVQPTEEKGDLPGLIWVS